MTQTTLFRMTSPLLAAMMTASCATPPSRPEPVDGSTDRGSLQTFLQAKLAVDDFSGVAVAVHRGALAASAARGVLGAPGTPAITTSTRFNIASAGKMFTAVAIAQLVDGGKLRFTDQVGMYVPGLSPEAASVTIEQLLTHTSGLGDFFSPANIPVLSRARTAADLLPLIASEKPRFTPGSQFQYSNSGFALLGVVVERVSGEVYGEYLRRHVFQPAGMDATSLDAEPVESLAQPLTARTPGGAAGPLHPAPGAMLHGSPAGGAFSSAADLEKFASALLSNRLTSAALTTALLARKAQGPISERGYGYGFGIKTRHNRTWVGHGGGTLGANAELAFEPDGEWILIVLSNRDPPSATRALEDLEDWIAGTRGG